MLSTPVYFQHPALSNTARRDDALLALQIVATLGLTGVPPGDAGDVVFIRAVRDDQRHGGVGLQTEVGRMTFPFTQGEA